MTVIEDVDTVKKRLLELKLLSPYDSGNIFSTLKTYHEVMLPFLTDGEEKQLAEVEQLVIGEIKKTMTGKKSHAISALSYYEGLLRKLSDRELPSRAVIQRREIH